MSSRDGKAATSGKPPPGSVQSVATSVTTAFVEKRAATPDSAQRLFQRLREVLAAHEPAYQEEETEHPGMPASSTSLSRARSTDSIAAAGTKGAASSAADAAGGLQHATSELETILAPRIGSGQTKLAMSRRAGRAIVDAFATMLSVIGERATITTTPSEALGPRARAAAAASSSSSLSSVRGNRGSKQPGPHAKGNVGKGAAAESAAWTADAIAPVTEEMYGALQSFLVHCNASPALVGVVSQQQSLTTLLEVAETHQQYHHAKHGIAVEAHSQGPSRKRETPTRRLSHRQPSTPPSSPAAAGGGNSQRGRSESPSETPSFLRGAVTPTQAPRGTHTAPSTDAWPVATSHRRNFRAEVAALRDALAVKPLTAAHTAGLVDAYCLEFLVDVALPPAVCTSRFEALQSAAWSKKADFVANASTTRGFAGAFLKAMPMPVVLNLVRFAMEADAAVRVRFFDSLVSEGLLPALTTALKEGAMALQQEAVHAQLSHLPKVAGPARQRREANAKAVEALRAASCAFDILLLLSAPAETGTSTTADDDAAIEQPARSRRRTEAVDESGEPVGNPLDLDSARRSRPRAETAAPSAPKNGASNSVPRPGPKQPMHDDGTPVYGMMLLRTTQTLTYCTMWATRPETADVVAAAFAVLRASTALRHAATSPRAYLAGILQDKAAQTLSQSAVFSTGLLLQVVGGISELADQQQAHTAQQRHAGDKRHPGGGGGAAATSQKSQESSQSTPSQRGRPKSNSRPPLAPPSTPAPRGRPPVAPAPAPSKRASNQPGSTASHQALSATEQRVLLKVLTVLLPTVEAVVRCISGIRENETVVAKLQREGASVEATSAAFLLIDRVVTDVASNITQWCGAFAAALDHCAVAIGLVAQALAESRTQSQQSSRAGSAQPERMPSLKLPSSSSRCGGLSSAAALLHDTAHTEKQRCGPGASSPGGVSPRAVPANDPWAIGAQSGGRHMQRSLLPFFRFWINVAPTLRKTAAVAAATPSVPMSRKAAKTNTGSNNAATKKTTGATAASTSRARSASQSRSGAAGAKELAEQSASAPALAACVELTPAVERLGLAVKRCAARLLDAQPRRSRIGRDNMVLAAARAVLRVDFEFSDGTAHGASPESLLLRLGTVKKPDPTEAALAEFGSPYRDVLETIQHIRDSSHTHDRAAAAVHKKGGTTKKSASRAKEEGATRRSGSKRVSQRQAASEESDGSDPDDYVSKLPPRRRSSTTLITGASPPERGARRAESPAPSTPFATPLSRERGQTDSDDEVEESVATPKKRTPAKSATPKKTNASVPRTKHPVATTSKSPSGKAAAVAAPSATPPGKRARTSAQFFDAAEDDLSPPPLTLTASSMIALSANDATTTVRGAAAGRAKAGARPASLAAAFKRVASSSTGATDRTGADASATAKSPAARNTPMVADGDATPDLTIGQLFDRQAGSKAPRDESHRQPQAGAAKRGQPPAAAPRTSRGRLASAATAAKRPSSVRRSTVNTFDVHDDVGIATPSASQAVPRSKGNTRYDNDDDDEVLVPAAAPAASRPVDDLKPSIGQRVGRLVSSLVSVVSRSRPASMDRPSGSQATPPSSPARNNSFDATTSPGGSPIGRVTMWARSLTSGSLS